jgi:UPF0176 protein
MQQNFVIAAFYSFFEFPEFEATQIPLLKVMKSLDICGSVLISPEGVNSTIAGSRENLDEFINHLKTQIIKSEILEYKESFTDKKPFSKSKVRLKQETISIGEPVSLKNVGTYLDAKQWNELLNDPDVILIDTRNEYEINLGTFENAINPKIRKFKQLPAFVRSELSDAKNKKIATFCTGGIRCEKFTSWLVENGFHNAYHLKGGILQYLEDTPQASSKWHGECYVFDERVAVDHNLNTSKIAHY